MLQKLWFQHVWPCLQQEMRTQEVLASVLQPIIYLIQECTLEEYEIVILPPFRYGNSSPLYNVEFEPSPCLKRFDLSLMFIFVK